YLLDDLRDNQRQTAYRVRTCSSVDCSTRQASLSSAFSAGRFSRHEMCNASCVSLPLSDASSRTAWLIKETAWLNRGGSSGIPKIARHGVLPCASASNASTHSG